jgi:hypothetical protein
MITPIINQEDVINVIYDLNSLEPALMTNTMLRVIDHCNEVPLFQINCHL